MVGIGVGIGIVLLIVPGVWLGTIWGLALPALLVERTGVFGALGRSRALVRGRFWAVLGLLVLAFLRDALQRGPDRGSAGAVAAAAGADAEAAGAVAALVSGVASMAFAVPLATAMLFVMYVDQRVRSDGLTIARARRRARRAGCAAGRGRRRRRPGAAAGGASRRVAAAARRPGNFDRILNEPSVAHAGVRSRS